MWTLIRTTNSILEQAFVYFETERQDEDEHLKWTVGASYEQGL